MIDLATGTLVVLAGGESSRMGSQKSALLIQGVPILHYLLQQFAWPGPTLLITAPGREQPPGAELFTLEVADTIAKGPLNGLLTGLQQTRTDWAVAVTVDMPGIDHELVKRLAGMLLEAELCSGIMLRREGNIEPFPLAIRTSCRQWLATQIVEGARSAKTLQTFKDWLVVDAPRTWPASAWWNLNTLADLQQFRDHILPVKTDLP